MEYGYNRGGFMSSIPPVTKNIILVNILFFIGTLVNQNTMIENFAVFYPSSPFFKPWQVVTHLFMHGGFAHIFFNMYTLFFFGVALERTLGPRKFLVYYMIAGLGAWALHTGVEYLQLQSALDSGSQAYVGRLLSTPTLGASGAVYGVLLGFALLFPNERMMLIFPPVVLKAKWMVLIFAGIELLVGVTGTNDGVAHFAHLGGMLFGGLLMLWWKRSRRLWDQNLWI